MAQPDDAPPADEPQDDSVPDDIPTGLPEGGDDPAPLGAEDDPEPEGVGDVQRGESAMPGIPDEDEPFADG